MHWYYTCARHKHDLPVLPIALYLGVALEGLGVDIYREDYSPPPADGQEPLSWQVLQFRFNYIGLPGLDALEHLQQDNLLALALVGLMRIPPGRKAWIKAEALRKIYAAGESEQRTYLLTECLETYLQLEEQEQEEFEEIVQKEEYGQVIRIGKTSRELAFEQGIEEGRQNLLIDLLQQKFGKLEPEIKHKIKHSSEEEIRRLSRKILHAESLKDLDLE